MKRLLLPLLAALIALPAAASAAQLKVASITSNSVLTDAEKGVVYSPENALDDELSTYWVEAEGSAGLGKYIEVTFDGEVELAKIRIMGGCFVDQDWWERHNRVAQLEAKYPDFTSEKFELEDKMEPQWMVLAEPKKLTRFKLYLRRVEAGNTWNDTAISKLEFFDKEGPVSLVEGTTATASSIYDNDAAYGAPFAVDGWTDTHWVEGSGKGGDGEFLEIDLGGSKSLKRFAVSTGWSQTESLFKGYNRAGKVTLTFSDGSSQSFDLADVQELQGFDLKPVTTTRVKVTFGKIIKGVSHNDLYVGEVRFFE